MKKIVYKVFHSCAFPEYVTEFNSMKKAVALSKSKKIPIVGV